MQATIALRIEIQQMIAKINLMPIEELQTEAIRINTSLVKSSVTKLESLAVTQTIFHRLFSIY